MSIEAMKQAIAALETCRIRSVSEWSVEDITPKNVTAAIAALRTAIQQAEAQQPATPEPVGFTYRTEIEYADFTGRNGSFWRVPPDLDDEAVPLYDHPVPSVPDGYMLVKTEDMVRLVNLIGPAPVEHGGKTFTFNMPNPEENLRLISATVRSMLAAK